MSFNVEIAPPNGECEACGRPKPKNKACAICGAFNRADRPVVLDPSTAKLVATMVDIERLRIRKALRKKYSPGLWAQGASVGWRFIENATRAARRGMR